MQLGLGFRFSIYCSTLSCSVLNACISDPIKLKLGRVSKLSQPSGNPNSIDGNGNSRKWMGSPDLIA